MLLVMCFCSCRCAEQNVLLYLSWINGLNVVMWTVSVVSEWCSECVVMCSECEVVVW
jgi:hypothetical protein